MPVIYVADVESFVIQPSQIIMRLTDETGLLRCIVNRIFLRMYCNLPAGRLDGLSSRTACSSFWLRRRLSFQYFAQLFIFHAQLLIFLQQFFDPLFQNAQMNVEITHPAF